MNIETPRKQHKTYVSIHCKVYGNNMPPLSLSLSHYNLFFKIYKRPKNNLDLCNYNNNETKNGKK